MILLYVSVWVSKLLHLRDMFENEPSLNHLNWPLLDVGEASYQHCQTSLCVCLLLKPEVMVSVSDVYFMDAVGIPLQSMHVYAIVTEVALIALTDQMTQKSNLYADTHNERQMDTHMPHCCCCSSLVCRIYRSCLISVKQE